MPSYILKQWPAKVYEKEIDPVWRAQETIDVLLLKMKKEGPAPSGYKSRHHGKGLSGIWQINLKVEKRQIRVLYAQYGLYLVILHIHKKSSPQEQAAGYALAVARKKTVDQLMAQKGAGPSGLYSIN